MHVAIAHDRCLLFNCDAVELPLPENSVDAIVTDPPAGISFMGKTWDDDKGGRDAWIAWLAQTLTPAFRALKPGGHALVWALPRTSHWTATALENLGFEIRDIHMHIFGSGFPKSLDVSKAIDKALGKERPVVGQCTAGAGNTEDSIYRTEAGGYARSREKVFDVTAPGSPEAAAWSGWGTALKPAAEHWILCRKPLAGTVAANVMQYGTGGLNIDATRIDGGARPHVVSDRRSGNISYGDGLQGSKAIGSTDLGRWPAHVSFDEEAAAVLDEQTGIMKDGVAVKRNTDGTKRNGATNFAMKSTGVDEGYGGSGGASRFFYCAKPSRREKEAGLGHLPQRTAGEATDREEGSAGLDNPRAGAGRTGGARNFHPTVKSIALMRWLVRLITPPGGTVLDPFAGSGTTGVAALAEGASFVGCEQNPEYIPITQGRLEHALKGGTE